MLRPVDLEGVFQGLSQPGEDLRQTAGQALAAAQGLSEEQGRPDNGEIEEQPDQQAVIGLWGLLQQRSPPVKRKILGTPGSIRRPQ